jgi:hypothetical protein
LDFQSIWWDEGHSIFVASHPIRDIATLPAMDVHPPAYFTLLHLWLRIAGQSEFTLRFLSVIFSLLTVALLARFAKTLSRAAFTLTALLAAISPLYVAYAQEVRSYSMITFLALAGTYMLWRILLSRCQGSVNGNWLLVIGYVLLTTACLYTHYFTLFLLFFHNLAWLVWLACYRQRHSVLKRDLLLWILTQLAMLVLFTPQLFLALRQITGYTNPNLTPPSLSDFILRTWQAYTVGLTLNPALASWGMALIAAILFISWLLLLFSQPQKPSPIVHYSLFIVHFSFLMAWFFLPLVAYFFVLQRQPSFEPRYLMLVTPALFLLWGVGLSNPTQVTGRLKQAARYLLILISLAVLLTGLYSYSTDPTYFKDDSAGVADWLATETTANDLIYVDVPHPFHYYADQGGIAAPLRYLFVDIHTAAETLSRETAGRERLFWLTWRGSDTDPRGVIPFLAQKYGQMLGQRDFRGYHLVWFSLPPEGVTFSLPTQLPSLNAVFGDVLRLDGAAYGGQPASGQTIRPGQPAWATLHFSLLRPTQVDYKVSLRLRSADGRVVAQVDRDLLNDRHFRTSAWPLADPALNQAINVYTLPLAADAAPGESHLEVVVYNAQPPYPSEGVSGSESQDGAAAMIGRLTLIP